MSHHSFYKNVFWQYGLQILKYLLPLILIPFLTRVLGTESYAVYAYTLMIMGIMQTIADFGFTLSGTKKITDNSGDKNVMSELVGSITIARLMLISLLTIATLLLACFVPIMQGNVPYVMLSFVAVALRSLLPDFVFQGFEQMRPLTTRYFISKGMTVVLTLLLVHSPADLVLVAFADIAGSAVGLVWSFAAMKKMFGVFISFKSARGSLCELRDSAIYCISNVSSSLLSGFTTLIIGFALTNKTDIAFWSLALTTVNAVQALYTPISNSLYPHMLNSKDFSFAKRLALLAFPALLAGTIAYCLLAEPVIFVFAGEEYLGAAQVMRMLSPVLGFSFYAILIGWPVLGAMGYVKELTATTIFVGILNVIALLVIYAAGIADLSTICTVRWGADALLAASRFTVLWSIVRNRHPRFDK